MSAKETEPVQKQSVRKRKLTTKNTAKKRSAKTTFIWNKSRWPLFKSAYMRLLMIISVIIVGTLVVLGMMLSYMIREQYVQAREQEMIRECGYINEIMVNWSDLDKRQEVKKELGAIARKYNASVWVIDRSGEAFVTSDPGTRWTVRSDVDAIKDESVREVLNSGITFRTTSFLNNIFNESVYTVGTPYIVDERIEGVIIMHRKLSDLVEAVNDLNRSIAVLSCSAVFLTVVCVSIVAHRFTRPLVEMGRVARSYAKGDFTQRVQVISVDEIGQLAQSFNAMAQDLQGLEDMRRSFVANVSHELKSPLASMRGFLQAILDGSVPEKDQHEYLQIVFGETIRLSGLINDLLDLSKIESGEFPVKKTNFDINELIARTLFTFETRIDEKELDVQLVFSQERCLVFADSDRISQVLCNLIDNAIKFSETKGILRVKTYILRKKNRVYITVQDNGCGIPSEDLRHIWERFYKVEKAHTPGSEGTGLGLSIVKRIIDQHDSRIFVTSRLGRGTIFCFTLSAAHEGTLPSRIR